MLALTDNTVTVRFPETDTTPSTAQTYRYAPPGKNNMPWELVGYE